MSDKPELKPCPICGEPVEVDGYKEGSCLDICCCVSMTLQKSDCLTIEERQTWVGDSENRIYRFSDQAEDKALADIVRRWNQRADLAKPSEWIRVELLKDDKWLADNGLKRFCKKCNGEGKTPIYTNLGGDMYLSHYEPCECVAVVSFP